MNCPHNHDDQRGATNEIGYHGGEGPGLRSSPAEFSPSFVAQ